MMRHDRVTLHHGDCLEVLRTLPDASVDSVVTDPPYGLEFMGKEWDGADGFRRSLNPNDAGRDSAFGRASRTSPEHRAGSTFQQWCEEWARECLRVLKPGGHLLAFGGTRTWHRLACAVEDAGFEVRDSIAWLYGSGFAKSWNFKTQFKGEWCGCNALPYNHADNTDLPRVRDDIHPPTVARGEGQNAVLLAPVQRGGEGSGVGEARPQGQGGLVPGSGSLSVGEDDRPTESRMEGRELHRRQGLSQSSDAEPPERPAERLRPRARVGHGADDRAPGGVAGGGAPHQRTAGGQPAGEPAPLPEPYGALDDGALRDGPVCARCGGLEQVYRGFGSALKPAFEPVVVARKPLVGTVAQNVTTHGTGALNIDACRIGTGADKGVWPVTERRHADVAYTLQPTETDRSTGRWPANVVLDESQADALDQQSGTTTSTGGKIRSASREATQGASNGGAQGGYNLKGGAERLIRGDTGGASRFFYVAKAPKRERPRTDDGTAHPTVKPLALMRWLVRLVTPPGGVVLEPFAGSGTTVEACILEGFQCVAIEREADYLPLIEARIARQLDAQEQAEPDLFDLLGEATA